jgi:hypothetical protein
MELTFGIGTIHVNLLVIVEGVGFVEEARPQARSFSSPPQTFNNDPDSAKQALPKRKPS